MPHSNDRTIVSAAGDWEIRIFDIEYSSASSGSSSSSNRVPGYMHQGVQYLSDTDANGKVFRSHSDRVKRIVTESSPFLFLSCSEDGEVRQWDIRLPSSAYPPRHARGFGPSQQEENDVPPPLISYKRHRLDLNTISCSPSQPHYIALGGSHLHCFLHDRRMLGRDKPAEKGLRNGSPASSSGGLSEHQDNLMAEATQCVKRMAPQGQSKMKRTGNGHITACKISDANPNELVASWSGDWIYGFNLLHSPDARDRQRGGKAPTRSANHSSVVKESRDRKRKRAPVGSSTSLEAQKRGGSKARKTPDDGEADMALKVRYQNGQSENIILLNEEREPTEPQQSEGADGPSQNQTEARVKCYRIAEMVVRIRKAMFGGRTPGPVTDHDPTGLGDSFSRVVGYAATVINDADQIMREWRYPVDPDELDVAFHTTLMTNRERVRRFIQAAGTLGRLLGGTQMARDAPSDTTDRFQCIEPVPKELSTGHEVESFRYDFLKAIILWLDSGPGAVVVGFERRRDRGRSNSRFPIPENSGIDAIDDILIPYLLQRATDNPIPNVSASVFEVDESRRAFATEKAAVLTFANAIKIPFEDLNSAVVPVSSSSSSNEGEPHRGITAQDRKTALRFWACKVGRGLLLNASEGVTHAFTDNAFGGLGKTSPQLLADERQLVSRLEDIDPEETEEPIASVGMTRPDGSQPYEDETEVSEEEDADMVPVEDIYTAMEEAEENGYEDDDDEDADDEGPERDSEEDEEGEGAEDDDEEPQSFLFRSAYNTSARRRRVHTSVPCIPSQRSYQGAANVRTVKDVNFYGLQDEYVVAGSDSGHLFLWDRHTSQRVNILEGDGEVVNVIQGHPYEPMLAVSGIDHTVKIFGPDARARRAARRGDGVKRADATGFSSLRLGGRTRFGTARRPPRRYPEPDPMAEDEPPHDEEVTSEPAVSASPDDAGAESDASDAPPGEQGLASRRKMQFEYAITSQNDVDRREGHHDTFMTRGMLAQLVRGVQLQRQQRRRRQGGQGGGGDHGAGADGRGEGAGAAEQGEGGANGAGDAVAEGEEEGEMMELDEEDLEAMPIAFADGRLVVGQDCQVSSFLLPSCTVCALSCSGGTSS